MTKVVVVRPYRDIKLNRKFEVGDVLEVSDVRFAVLQGANKYKQVYVEDLSKQTVSELKELLTQKGIEFDNGLKKAELLELFEG